jgi:hypothetical protein
MDGAAVSAPVSTPRELDGLRRSKPVENDLDVLPPVIRRSRPEHRADQVQDVLGTNVGT